MFRTHARKIALALSLIAAAGMMIPTAQPTAAAAMSGDTAATAALLEVGPATPKPELQFNKMTVSPRAVVNNGRITFYTFRIQAESGNLNNTNVKASSSYRYISNNAVSGDSAPHFETPGTFSAPNYRDVHITCNPPAGMYCTAAFITVSTSNGLLVHSADATDGLKAP